MDKYEFQINYYFNLYKDMPIKNTKEFKGKFEKKHGKFQYLNEVILKINKYQIKKYGNSLLDLPEKKTREQYIRINLNARVREWRKKENK